MFSKKFLQSLLIQSSGFIFNIATIAFIAQSLSLTEFGSFSLVVSIITVLVIFVTSGTSDFSVKEVSNANYYNNSVKLAEIGFYSFAISIILSTFIGLVLILVSYMNEILNFELAVFIIVSIFSLSLISLISSMLRGLGYAVLGQTLNIFIFPFLFLLLIVASIFLNFPFTTEDGRDVILTRTLASFFALFLTIPFFIYFWPIKLKRILSSQFKTEWMDTSYQFLKIGLYGTISRQAGIFLLAIFASMIKVGEYRIVLLAIIVFEQISIVGIILLQAKFAEGEIYERSKKFKTQIFQIYGSIFLISFIGLIVFIFIGKQLISLAFGEAYLGTYFPIIIALIGHMVNLLFGPVGIFLTMRGYAKLVSFNLGISLFINLLLSSLLITQYDIVGATLGFIIGIFTFNVLSLFSCLKELKFNTSLISAIQASPFLRPK